MPAPYSPKAIANAFLQKAFNANIPISHLKLQKLVYLAHGYHLAAKGGVPLVDEPFEAWEYGPVSNSLYGEFRDAGKGPINRLATDFEFDTDDGTPTPAPTGDPDADKVIDYVFKAYARRSAYSLSDLTHKPTWAWKAARDANTYGLKKQQISNERIKQDFDPFIRRDKSG